MNQIIILCGFLTSIIVFRVTRLLMRRRFDHKHSQTLRFLHVKIPKKASEAEQRDSSIQHMKQNIEVMNQVLKNVSSLSNHSRYGRWIGQPYCSIEVLVEKELIKYIVAVPEDYIDTFEKFISSFYPGAVIDSIAQPKLCETGKYWA